MSTISSAASAYSPRQNILDYLSNQVKTGAVSGADQTAIDSALDDIDSALTKDGSTATTAALDPKSIKQRIDALIDKEVGDGKLTSAQANELKSAIQHSRGGGHGHHHGGAGGVTEQSTPPTLASFDLGADDSATGDASSSSILGTQSTSAGGNATDLLTQFIKQLQSALGQSGAYTQSGAPQRQSNSTAFLVNYQA